MDWLTRGPCCGRRLEQHRHGTEPRKPWPLWAGAGRHNIRAGQCHESGTSTCAGREAAVAQEEAPGVGAIWEALDKEAANGAEAMGIKVQIGHRRPKRHLTR